MKNPYCNHRGSNHRDPTIEDPTTGGSAKSDNAKVTAQAVRKESKSASKLLLSKVGRTLMGRLSYIRHKNKQESSFSANDFVNGIQVSFADSQTNSLINRVLSANGLSNVSPPPAVRLSVGILGRMPKW
ncbi:hypothetical protein BSPWISOXPB_2548 [uncultured Gammaproteobacteria bacterium]|nr:hypothetical protein BSPWISOXPB_2548 [uncultured Gammaproteobacteria bacterium]